MMVLMLPSVAFAQKSAGKRRVTTQRTATAQQTWDFSIIDNLLPLYVTAKKENKDFNSPLTGILVFYGGPNDTGKRECRKYLVDKMDGYYNEQKPTEALAVADIYESIAPVNDFGRLRLYFYRGEQAATAKGDTVMLKQYIDNIISLPDAGNERKQECLSTLNGYLEEIRNYIPVDKTIDGVWVSDIWNTFSGYPYFVLEIHTDERGKTTFTLQARSEYLAYTSSAWSPWGKQTAQEEFVFNTDSIYAAWSNEDMKKPSPELNCMFRQTAGTFASVLGTKATIEGNAALGNLTSSIVGLGVDAIADAIFTPSKRAYFLQMKMRKLNDRQIEADVFSTKLKVKGDSKPKLTDDKWKALFTKIEPEDSLFWMYYGTPDFLFDNSEVFLKDIQDELMKELAKYNVKESSKEAQQEVAKLLSKEKALKELPEDMQKRLPKTLSKEDKKNIKKKYGIKASSGYDELKAFNSFQYNKMYYKNEEKLIEQGETNLSNVVNIHNSHITPVIGVIFDENSTTISKVIKYTPADFAELKKEDIITHVNGYEVNTAEQFKRIITRKKPFDTVTLTIKRKKKTMEIPLELYFCKEQENTNL